MLVDDNAEDHAVKTRDDAAVELGRARVDGHRVALGRIADLVDAGTCQHFQNGAAVEARAANEEVAGRRAPAFFQPFLVGLKPAGCCHQRARAHGHGAIGLLDVGPKEHAVFNVHRQHFGIIGNIDAQILRRQIQRVQHGAAAAKEEGIGAAKRQCAAKRGLEADALIGDPGQHLLRLMDHHLRELFIGVAARHAQQVVEEFVFVIGTRQGLGGRIMRAAHIARVARVAAPVEFRGRLQHQHRGTLTTRCNGRTQGGIAAADHKNVISFREIDQVSLRDRQDSRRRSGCFPSRISLDTKKCNVPSERFDGPWLIVFWQIAAMACRWARRCFAPCARPCAWASTSRATVCARRRWRPASTSAARRCARPSAGWCRKGSSPMRRGVASSCAGSRHPRWSSFTSCAKFSRPPPRVWPRAMPRTPRSRPCTISRRVSRLQLAIRWKWRG